MTSTVGSFMNSLFVLNDDASSFFDTFSSSSSLHFIPFIVIIYYVVAHAKHFKLTFVYKWLTFKCESYSATEIVTRVRCARTRNCSAIFLQFCSALLALADCDGDLLRMVLIVSIVEWMRNDTKKGTSQWQSLLANSTVMLRVSKHHALIVEGNLLSFYPN